MVPLTLYLMQPPNIQVDDETHKMIKEEPSAGKSRRGDQNNLVTIELEAVAATVAQAPPASTTALENTSSSTNPQSTPPPAAMAPPQRQSLGKLLIATVVNLGVQVDWAVQAALLMPYLLVIGVPYKYYSVVCLCGPISGLIAQPYMGVVSDHCHSRFGRRRPFIFGSVLLIVLGFMLIGNATYLGALLPDSASQRGGAMAAATVGLWIIDMANNGLAGPCRALIADIAPSEQQRLGNALIAVWSSIGNVIGFVMCAVPWTHFMPLLESPQCRMQCADLRIVAVICAICLLITSLLTVFTTHEEPLQVDSEHAPEGERSPLGLIRKIFGTLFNMPPALARVCAFQFFSWWSWFHHTLFIAVWVGKVVNQGDGGAPVGSEAYVRYERGIKAASLGFVIFAILTGLVSIALPNILHRFKTRPTLAVAQLLLAGCYGLTFLVPRRKIYAAAIVIGMFALPWAVFLVVPWALIAQMAPPDKRGLYLGSLNIFACVPQVLVALSGPIFVKIFAEEKATQAALGFGAILALVSLLLVPGLITKARPNARAPQGAEGEMDAKKEERDKVWQVVDAGEGTAMGGGATALPFLEEEKEGIERLVEQPLLRIYREVSSG